MSGRLAGRRGLVTGCGRGIGRALALGVAGEGAAVACLDLDGDGAQRTAEDVERAGGRAIAVTCDVTDAAACAAAVARVVAELGGLDLLVANAGGSLGEVVPFLDLDAATWRRMLVRNLDGAFHCALPAARHMAANGGGTIVVVSSQLTETVRPGMAHYAASKGGLRQLVRGMAVDLARAGIRVNALAPGPTWTEGTRAMFERPEVAAYHRARIPLGRVAEPEEMVGACVFLASAESSYVTGTTLFVDGGYTVA